ncbi:MAG TPA: threonine ammonia-lyase, biosynthetic [Thermoanaerobaculia bacterium]|nr:threonine ammonia-lyase, biosynthetic [Thermoanaerobaculia bacterium]
MNDYLERILDARVYDVAIETPLEPALKLSRRVGQRVLCKREDLQPVFSFKLRGAYNKIARLPAAAIARGVVCASAGNHAQGVALAARRRGVPATVVMPIASASIKVEAVRELGATVVLHGEGYDDAYAHALEVARESGAAFVHPFDDPDVIAGQGTVGLEILRQHPDPIAAIFVPIGGGGLAAGVATLVKGLRPQTRVVGVEPADAASMHAALAAGAPVTLPRVGAFADGVAVRRVGDETFRLCRRHLDEVVLVSTDEICAAIRDVFEDTRTIVEPAGALSVAGLKKWLGERSGATFEGPFVAIHGGANVNFSRLRYIAERTDLGDRREALLAVEIPERPGSFKTFCEAIGARHVTEFNYRYGDSERARIFVGIELGGGAKGASERIELVSRLRSSGYPALDLSDNELAKEHLRHMVGGYGHGVADERLYRFVFPERRGALLDFLRAIGGHWNISLFHYRNHGSDHGRVLVGIQTPAAELPDLRSHLDRLGFAYTDESENPAYTMFLAGRR